MMIFNGMKMAHIGDADSSSYAFQSTAGMEPDLSGPSCFRFFFPYFTTFEAGKIFPSKDSVFPVNRSIHEMI